MLSVAKPARVTPVMVTLGGFSDYVTYRFIDRVIVKLLDLLLFDVMYVHFMVVIFLAPQSV